MKRGTRTIGGWLCSSVRFGLTLSLALPLLARAVDSPEYITSEEPIPKSLEDASSATDQVGLVPDFRPFRGQLLPSRLLPRLRERIPKTGQPFLDDAVFHVDPRAYYRWRDNGDGTKSEAFAMGGAAGVESGYFANVARIGLAAYTSQKLYGPKDRDGSGLLRARQESYTTLGEAYADLKFKRSFLTLGWQRIDVPYLNGNDGRMTPNTFEGLVIRSTELENLQVGFGHITRMRFRNSTDYQFMSERAGAAASEHGVSSAGLRYNFSKNFNVSMVDHYGWDSFNTLYMEMNRFVPLSDEVSLKFGAQFTDQRSAGDELLGDFDAQLFGVKGSFGYRSLIASASFTWASREAGVMKPWGGSPSYNSVMISDFDRAGEKAIRTGISYDFSGIGLKDFAASASWLYGDTPDSGSTASADQHEVDFNFDYQPSVKGLENFWFRVRYALNERNDDDGGIDRKDLRVILNYSFLF